MYTQSIMYIYRYHRVWRLIFNCAVTSWFVLHSEIFFGPMRCFALRDMFWAFEICFALTDVFWAYGMCGTQGYVLGL